MEGMNECDNDNCARSQDRKTARFSTGDRPIRGRDPPIVSGIVSGISGILGISHCIQIWHTFEFEFANVFEFHFKIWHTFEFEFAI